MNNKPNENKHEYQRLVNIFGFIIHKSFGWNLFIIFCLNMIIGAGVIGLLSPFRQVVTGSFLGYFLFMVIFTFIEYILLLLTIRFIPKLIFYSAGIIIILIELLNIFLVNLIVTGFNFVSPQIGNMVLFLIIFLMLRWTISLALRKYFNR